MSPHIIVRWLLALLLVIAFSFGEAPKLYAQTAASTGFSPGQIATKSCWTDVATGGHPRTGPPGWDGMSDHVDFGGHGWAALGDGSWVDVATGKHPRTGPPGWDGMSDHVTFGGRTWVRVSCPPPQQPAQINSPAPPSSPPPVRTATSSALGISPPPASYFGAPFGLSAGTLGFDYTHFSPSAGNNGDQWGVTGSGLFPLTSGFAINLDAGYHNVSSKGFDLDSWNIAGSLAWQLDKWRFGPSLGYQSNSASGYSTDTYNYGAYADYFVTPRFTLSGKGGGFSSSPGSGGYYLGGQIKGYITPNFLIGGRVDATHFSAYGGSDEDDYGIFSEYLFWDDEDEDDDDCWWPPTSIYGGYVYSDFSPGHFHVDTVFVGIKLYTDGTGADTLVDRQRTGSLDWSSSFAPLSFRF